MEQKYFICKHCGNVVTKLVDGNTPVWCCGEKMEELVPGTSDGAGEKHIPVYEVANNLVKVKVGEVAHPMVEVHYIQWIAIHTNLGTQIKYLQPSDAPEASFALLEQESVQAVYAYCNIHGLWKK